MMYKYQKSQIIVINDMSLHVTLELLDINSEQVYALPT